MSFSHMTYYFILKQLYFSGILAPKCIPVFLMQARVEQKLSGSSFVGGYLSGISAHHSSIRLTVIDT
jgi:hypothetical protein